MGGRLPIIRFFCLNKRLSGVIYANFCLFLPFLPIFATIPSPFMSTPGYSILKRNKIPPLRYPYCHSTIRIVLLYDHILHSNYDNSLISIRSQYDHTMVIL